MEQYRGKLAMGNFVTFAYKPDYWYYKPYGFMGLRVLWEHGTRGHYIYLSACRLHESILQKKGRPAVPMLGLLSTTIIIKKKAYIEFNLEYIKLTPIPRELHNAFIHHLNLYKFQSSEKHMYQLAGAMHHLTSEAQYQVEPKILENC